MRKRARENIAKESAFLCSDLERVNIVERIENKVAKQRTIDKKSQRPKSSVFEIIILLNIGER